MAEGFVHTVHKDGDWLNELESGGPLPGHFPTKESAVKAGREQAIERSTEHVIHDLDGSISERHSYGNDPVDRAG
jgi:uncharacterized protein DUF2188